MVKSAFSVNAEYVLLRVACALLNLIPYPIAMALARGVGWLAVVVFRYKHRRTFDRIRTAFPGKSAREVRRIAVGSLQNVLMGGVEMMRAPRLDRAWMDRHVKDGLLYKNRLQSYVDEGHGVVIMVPHSGNWYMAAWSMAQYGLKLFALAAPQRNPKVDGWMRRQYSSIEVLYRNSRKSLVEIRDLLRSGRAFAILPDLRVPHPDVRVGFLGGEANVSHAAAMYAVRCGSPIVVAAMSRENGRHCFNHLATLRPDPNAEDARAEAVRLTREAMTILDGAVRRRPEEWFWYNKRWLLQPV